MTQKGMRAGVARANITPPVGATLTGFSARPLGSTGVRDPLFGTALVVDDGQNRSALITCDLMLVDPAFVRSVRQAVQAAAGIAPERVMICCSHTHSGPGVFSRATPRPVDVAYEQNLRFLLAGAVVAAVGDMQPVTLSCGVASSAAAINRRERRADGQMVLGHNPSGPVDHQVRVARFDRTDGRPLAAVVNYACHPVVLGPTSTVISADYVGHLRATVEEIVGGMMLFVQGTCGDINPRLGPAADDGQARAIGLEVAGAAITALAIAGPVSVEGLGAAVERLDLPIMDDTSGIPNLAAAEARPTLSPAASQQLPVQAEVTSDAVTGRQSVPIEVQALRIGGIALVGLPVEPFVEIGLALQEGRPDGMTMVAGYTNGCAGYVPTPDAYALGGYEVSVSFAYFGLPRPFAPQCARLLVAAGRRLLAQVGPTTP